MPFSTGMRLATRSQVAAVIPPANYTGAASTDIYISLKNTPHATIIIQTGAWAAGTAAVTLLQATAVAGTSTKALTGAMPVMYTNVSDTSKATLVETTVTSDTFNLTAANSVYLIEVDAASLDVANGFDCLCVHVASPGANADIYGALIITGQGRYTGASPPNVLAD